MTTCRRGHELVNVYVRPNGQRSCRECRKSEKLPSLKPPVDDDEVRRCMEAQGDGVNRSLRLERFGWAVTKEAEKRRKAR